MKITLRFFITILIIYLFILVIVQGWRVINRPSDGTYWSGIPSHLYFNRDVSVLNRNNDLISDSILQGDLLLTINGQKVRSIRKVDKILETTSASDTLILEVFRTTHNKKYKFNVARQLLTEKFIRKIPPAIYIKKVYKYGPAEQAGMKNGDIIIGIDGYDFFGDTISEAKSSALTDLESQDAPRYKSLLEAEQRLRSASIGKILDFNVLRGGQYITVHITLQRFGLTNPLICMLLVSIIIWIIYSGCYYIGFIPYRKTFPTFGLPIGYLLFILITREINYTTWPIMLDIGIPLSWFLFFLSRKYKRYIHKPRFHLFIRIRDFIKERVSERLFREEFIDGEDATDPIEFIQMYKETFKMKRMMVTILRILLVILIWIFVLDNISAGKPILAAYLFFIMLLICVYIVLEIRNLSSDINLVDEALLSTELLSELGYKDNSKHKEMEHLFDEMIDIIDQEADRRVQKKLRDEEKRRKKERLEKEKSDRQLRDIQEQEKRHKEKKQREQEERHQEEKRLVKMRNLIEEERKRYV
ncbi:MAG: hypothetical protein ACMUIU_11530 [bacterium]